MKGNQSLLGHVGFHRRFFKKFSKIANCLCKILDKEVNFDFDDAFVKAFECIKEKLIFAPVIIGPDWVEPFEVMRDASGNTLGVVLGHKHNRIFHQIYYANKSLNGAQKNTIYKSYWLWYMYSKSLGRTC